MEVGGATCFHSAYLIIKLSRVPYGEANGSSSIPEIARDLGNRTVPNYICNSLQLFTFLSQIDQMHVLPACFFKIEFTSIIPSPPMSSKLPPSFIFPHQNPVRISLFPYMCHMSRKFHVLWLDYPTNFRWDLKSIKVVTMQCSQFLLYFLLPRPKLPSSTPFYRRISAYSLSLRGQTKRHICTKHWLHL